MAKRPSYRRLPSDKRREEIIEAAVEVFGRRPEHEVSIDDIAAAAGTARSSIYRYFTSKEELYGASIERVGTELIKRLYEPTDGSPSESVTVRLRIYFDFIEEYAGGYASVLGMGSPGATPDAFAVAQEVRERILQLTCRTIEATDPSEILQMTIRSWIASVEWTGSEWLRTRTPPRPQVEQLLAAQLGVLLIGAGGLDRQVADRVAWLMTVEPTDSPFGRLLRAIAGMFSMRMFAQLSRHLSYDGRFQDP